MAVPLVSTPPKVAESVEVKLPSNPGVPPLAVQFAGVAETAPQIPLAVGVPDALAGVDEGGVSNADIAIDTFTGETFARDAEAEGARRGTATGVC